MQYTDISPWWKVNVQSLLQSRSHWNRTESNSSTKGKYSNFDSAFCTTCTRLEIHRTPRSLLHKHTHKLTTHVVPTDITSQLRPQTCRPRTGLLVFIQTQKALYFAVSSTRTQTREWHDNTIEHVSVMVLSAQLIDTKVISLRQVIIVRAGLLEKQHTT